MLSELETVRLRRVFTESMHMLETVADLRPVSHLRVYRAILSQM